MENDGFNVFSEEVIEYILSNENADPYALALKKSPFQDVEIKEIAQQIMGRNVAKKKFPFLLEYRQYRYPRKVSLEQASSEKTAKFKAGLMKGSSFVDLTGGMGIDTYLLGKNFQTCTYVEPNVDLFHLTKYNFDQLQFEQCHIINSTCEAFLEGNDQQFDWAYIDPSRRIGGSRKISIHNYEPNLVELQRKLADLADNVLIKLSPMQDVSECISMLNNVVNIWVISVANEVKELLLHVKKGDNSSPKITAVNINDKSGDETFTFFFQKRVCVPTIGMLRAYIYQPLAALVKAEIHDRYAAEKGLIKLNANTNLYTSSERVDNFMGRTFHLEKQITLSKKEIRKVLPEMKANVIAKNFPLSSEEILKKFALKSGGEKYLIAFKNAEEKKTVAIFRRE